MRFLFFIILLSVFCVNITHSGESYVVLKVNNKIITNLDIEHEYHYLIALNNSLKDVDKEKVMKLAKNSIIREKIKETELMKYYDLNQPNKYIDEILEDFYKKLGINDVAVFKKYLLSYNLLFDDVQKKISLEAAWNELIYGKFINKIEIDELKIKKKIEMEISNNKKQNIFLLSEILFYSDKIEDIDKKYKLIKKSITEIGFENAANIHSISDTAKLGGQIGWINENQLSGIIKKEVNKLKIGDYTTPITIPGGLLILKLANKKIEQTILNFEEEFNKHIIYEKNQQLNNFSKIYFNKVKKNSTISE